MVLPSLVLSKYGGQCYVSRSQDGLDSSDADCEVHFALPTSAPALEKNCEYKFDIDELGIPLFSAKFRASCCVLQFHPGSSNWSSEANLPIRV